jgi:hypothetical protein
MKVASFFLQVVTTLSSRGREEAPQSPVRWCTSRLLKKELPKKMSTEETALVKMMTYIDDNQQQLGSGLYVNLANLFKAVRDENDATLEMQKELLAILNVVEMPVTIRSAHAKRFATKDSFFKTIADIKCMHMRHLGEMDQRARSLESSMWQEAFVREMIDPISAMVGAFYLTRLRNNVRFLFVMRIGLFPLVIKRLQALNLTALKLFPSFYGEECDEDDDKGGATPCDILSLEPRMLRYFFGLEEGAPWPNATVAFAAVAAAAGAAAAVAVIHTLLKMLDTANDAGGDDTLVNSPCHCTRCLNNGLPTMPDNERQRTFVQNYRSANQWPITIFFNPAACKFRKSSDMSRGTLRDKHEMLTHCRDPKKGGGEWTCQTRSRKRPCRRNDNPMTSDLHTLPPWYQLYQRAFSHNVSE